MGDLRWWETGSNTLQQSRCIFFVKSNVHIKDHETEFFHRLLSQGLGHDMNGFHCTFTGFYFNHRFLFPVRIVLTFSLTS